jgi:glycosyltransferase involved in cell wall biosynthesis
MAKPEISIVVCTYQRPENLRRVLASIEGQKGVEGKLEVVVADDGSTDETPDVVARFARETPFPVRFVTHPHRGFCPGRGRNEGVAASSAEYLLLLDGDCLLPPDRARIHLRRRKRGRVLIGDRICLSREVTQGITEDIARRGDYQSLVSWDERVRVAKYAIKSAWYGLTRHATKPRLTSNNVGIWRDDYLRVNGFDENYVGWGCEDDDFGNRLRRLGLRLKATVWQTGSFHLWHPPDPTAPSRWEQGRNVEYFKRPFHLAQCGNGLVKRPVADIRVRIVGEAPNPKLLQQVLPHWCRPLPPNSPARAEVEILFAPSGHSFSGLADCNVLVVGEKYPKPAAADAEAHLVLSAGPALHVPPEFQFGLGELADALHWLLYNTRPAPASARHAA